MIRGNKREMFMKQLIISMLLVSMLSSGAALAQPPAILSAVSNKVPCGRNNGSITVVVSGTQPFRYVLNDENGNLVELVLFSNEFTNTFEGLKNGTYTIVVSNALGTSTPRPVVVKNALCPNLILCCSSCR